MTLVYATGGIDLSVAVLAISGAMAAYLIRPDYIRWRPGIPDPPTSMPIDRCAAADLDAGRIMEWFSRGLCWRSTNYCHPDFDGGGRGIAQLIIEGQILIFRHTGFEFVGGGFLLWPALSCGPGYHCARDHVLLKAKLR